MVQRRAPRRRQHPRSATGWGPTAPVGVVVERSDTRSRTRPRPLATRARGCATMSFFARAAVARDPHPARPMFFGTLPRASSLAVGVAYPRRARPLPAPRRARRRVGPVWLGYALAQARPRARRERLSSASRRRPSRRARSARRRRARCACTARPRGARSRGTARPRRRRPRRPPTRAAARDAWTRRMQREARRCARPLTRTRGGRAGRRRRRSPRRRDLRSRTTRRPRLATIRRWRGRSTARCWRLPPPRPTSGP